MSFAHPQLLWLLAVLPIGAAVVAWSRHRGRSRGEGAAVLPSAAPLERSPTTWRLAFRWVPGFLRLVALGLLVVALARPQESSGWTTTSTEGVAIQLVVDRSGSMAEPMGGDEAGAGAQETKEETAIDAITRFIEGDGKELKGRMGDMIGLIAFARYADTLSPMARAHEPLVDAAKRLKPVEVQAEDGTAIGDALALAAARLKRAEEEIQRQSAAASSDTKSANARPEFTIKSKVIILMTDGQNNAGQSSPYEAAELAKQWGIRLYTIGVGAGERVVTLNTPFGPQRMNAGSSVDERMLTDIAESTGGEYFSVSSAGSLANAYAAIDKLEKSKIDSTEHTKKTELFAPIAMGAMGAALCELLLAGAVFRRAA